MKYDPTMYLRWLTREYPTQAAGEVEIMQRVTVLQQAWVPSGGGHCEWRDVPTVEAPPSQEA